MPLIHNNKISYEHKSSDIYWLRSLLFLEHIRRKDITKQKNTFKIMMTKFTHAMTNFVFLQITVLSLTAERLPLTWFCAQGTQKDVQRPCTCQMQYTNVGQCARYKLSLQVKCIGPHASITCVIWCVYHRFNLAIRIG